MSKTITLTSIVSVVSLDNGVGRTPAMGYNTWNDFRCNSINAMNIKKVADKIISTGLDKVGYEYVNIDDCWAVSRENSGKIVEDPSAFPEGMKAVADYVHSKGLKFGIYTDRGTATCAGRPGSQGYETLDAQTYAEWGVDYVKEDSCNAADDHETAFQQYGLMRDALNATGRPIYFSLCGWASWYAPTGAELGNSWRIGYDVNGWNSFWGNAIRNNVALAQYAKPGAWNDPDMLVGSSSAAAVHQTRTQSRTQFSLLAMMASPLLIGSNILSITDFDLETYTNTEVIAVDQDPLGRQGTVVWSNCPGGALEVDQAVENGAVPACQQVWTKKLVDGYALAFVNYTVPNPSDQLDAEDPGKLALTPCDSSNRRQLWKVDTSGTAASIAALDGDDVPGYGLGCWEIRGCNYGEGATVDTDFGCKPDPAGSTDPCANNMAWNLNEDGTITSSYSGMCFTLDAALGGRLAKCTGDASQRWSLKGDSSHQQIVSSDGACVTNGQQPQPAGQLIFDVTALGWQAAQVRDLWDHKNLGLQTKISVELPMGDGASRIFKIMESRAVVV